MKKQVFIINGSGGVGKDTFVQMVIENSPLPVMNFSSVDKVKEIATIIGWDGGKSEKDRKFLSDLKLLCTEYNNLPFNSMKEKVEDFNNSFATMLFLHIREPREIEIANKAFNAKTILIRRNSVKQITSNMADGNVFNYTYDIQIDNDGELNDLNMKTIDFVQDYMLDSLKERY